MLIACPSCQRQLNVPDNAVGKQVRCPAPDCGTVFYVPAAAAPMPVAPVAPAAPARPAAPAKPAGRPAPAAPTPAPPPAPASPFDFGGGGAVAGPEADFGFTQHTDGGLKGIGLRTRITRAAGWLNIAAGSMVLFTLYLISITLASFFVSGGFRSWQASLIVGGLTCFMLILLVIPVCVVIASRMLSRGRRWGMALAAAIMSLIVGTLSVLFTLGFSIWTAMLWLGVGAAVAHGGGANAGTYAVLISCGTDILAAIVAFCGTTGGIVVLRTLLNAEVKKTFT